MYITLFDLLGSQLNHLIRLPRWKNISQANRALIVGILIIAVLLLLGGTAMVTPYHYVPLVTLGIFCGAVTAKVLGQFLAPKVQSHMTVFLGGITTGNIGSKEAGLRKAISAVSEEVNKLVAALPKTVGNLSDPLTFSIWIMLLTTLVILAANAYYANQASSPVGNRYHPILDSLSPSPNNQGQPTSAI